MNKLALRLPHWVLIAAAVLSATCAGMAQQPQFASWSSLLNVLATALLSLSVGTGVVSSSALSKGNPPPPGG